MRIITGIARGVKLATLEGEEITRPTTERTKEGIFSAIQFELAGKRVLDLFSGCGQMALEALSRGAESASGRYRSAANRNPVTGPSRSGECVRKVPFCS